MRYTISFIVLFLIVFSSHGLEKRERIPFNQNWRFCIGETGKESSIEFNDDGWRVLSLPHDWAIEGPFSEEHNARTGGLPVSGTAWYRKRFSLDKSYQGKIVNLEFDGVMSNAEVYINGHRVAYRPYGYIGFEADLTPYLKYGHDNVVAVKVAPEEQSSRWYPGAGIYRNVWMEIKNPVHVAHWGTYITTPTVSSKSALVKVSTTICRTTDKTGNYRLLSQIMDHKGTIVATAESDLKLDSEQIIVEQEIEIQSPQLWEQDNPHLYQLKSIIIRDGTTVDTYNSTFGVRTIEYSKTEGFLLNGRQVRFQGVCLHHDLGPLGAAVNYRATQRQLEIMKEMGVNAIRTSHNPPSPEQLELCDKMGILVQIEAFDCWKAPKTANGYHKYWDEWHERDLRDMIKRDRNHPSVVMYSIGNEIVEQRLGHGGKVASSLTAICHDEDPTRPVTAGFNMYPACVKNGLAEAIDLVGFNYKPTQYDNLLAEHPDWIVYGSETSSCVSSRGVYHLPLENYDKHESLQVSSYDIISPPWAYPPDFEFDAQQTMTRSLGEFVWTGFDYLGEPTPYNGQDNHTHGKWTGDWPSRSSYFGIVDLCGFPKDRFYLYQSVWTDKPMVHILPHWNWEDSPHDTIPVFCYTNCDEAELFLNGKSLGKKVMGKDKTTIPSVFNWWKKPQTTWDSPYRINWNVKYEPGELKVIAYNNGEVAASKTIVTASEPAQINLLPDRKIIEADGYDLSFITVRIEDKQGNFCPMADNLIHFDIKGPATIAAVGNGNAATTEPFQAHYRKAFNGLCMLIIKSEKGKAGKVSIKAYADNLNTGKIKIITN
ncbi:MULTISPECIES: beta-galactosidase GalB [unclassified Carboxylicivirga]|uniref:beta-galactosidase GalB n=1 Tax=Carboxylicivirga TaxID=1628153 RepID=UPI003D337BD2